jgi:hypothetical protein
VVSSGYGSSTALDYGANMIAMEVVFDRSFELPHELLDHH